MPHDAAEDSILKAEPEQRVRRLWRQLAPEHWPVPVDALPPGTALVGGAIRDGLIGRRRDKPDLDLVVPDQAIALTRQLARRHGGACVVLDEQRDMARLVLGGWTLDLARRDGSELEADLWRRDFRLNAIALELGPTPRLLDPTGGMGDLLAGRLAAVREQNLVDDPLRLLRAVRLTADLPLTIEAETWTMLRRWRTLLPQAAPERIQAELQRLVEGPRAVQALDSLADLELLEPWQERPGPQAPMATTGPALDQAAKGLDPMEQNLALPLLRLTACLGDRGLQALRFSRRQQQRCARLRYWLEQLHRQSPDTMEEEVRLRLHRELEEDLPALILQLPSQKQAAWLQRWRDRGDPLFHPRPPLDGRTLQQELALPQGPLLGQLLQHLCQERAFGRIQGAEEALTASRLWLTHQCG